MQISTILETFAIKPENPGVFIGGVNSLHDEQAANIQSIDPNTTQTLAQVALATETQYQTLMQHATAAAEVWREVPAPKRATVIYRLGELLRQHKLALGSLVALEMGKSKAEGDGEVQEMIDMADFAVGQSRMLYGKTIASEREQHRLLEQWQPLGVVGVITAFNFPVAVWAWNAFLAIVCGNSVVWKPSSKTPLCAIAVQHLCEQVLQELALPPIFNCIIADNTLATQLVDDPRISLVSFTGSSAVGQRVATRVAARFGKYCLELGGNNAIIVTPHANLELAIPAIVFGAVGTAGQRCTTTRRLIVHAKIIEEVVQRLKSAYQQLRIGSPLEPENHVGPLIDQAAVESYKTAIRAICEQGGEIIIGGQVPEREGFYVTPTLVNIDPSCKIVQQETFAPILYIHSYTDFDTALNIHNQVPQGLSSAIFSDNNYEIEQFLSSRGSDCGIANVNVGTSGAEIGGAFGGEKATGGGREAGSDAWQTYMRRQTVTLNGGRSLPLAQGIEFNI